MRADSKIVAPAHQVRHSTLGISMACAQRWQEWRDFHRIEDIIHCLSHRFGTTLRISNEPRSIVAPSANDWCGREKCHSAFAYEHLAQGANAAAPFERKRRFFSPFAPMGVWG